MPASTLSRAEEAILNILRSLKLDAAYRAKLPELLCPNNPHSADLRREQLANALPRLLGSELQALTSTLAISKPEFDEAIIELQSKGLIVPEPCAGGPSFCITSTGLAALASLVAANGQTADPSQTERTQGIWSVEDYYRTKKLYEENGAIFNPALPYGSPAAHHINAQARLRALTPKPPAETRNREVPPKAGEETSADMHSPNKSAAKLAPSRLKARAVYDWAIEEIHGADSMIMADLFKTIRSKLRDLIEQADERESDKLRLLLDSLPSNAETFGKYLREAGVKQYDNRGERRKKISHFKRRDRA